MDSPCDWARQESSKSSVRDHSVCVRVCVPQKSTKFRFHAIFPGSATTERLTSATIEQYKTPPSLSLTHPLLKWLILKYRDCVHTHTPKSVATGWQHTILQRTGSARLDFKSYKSTGSTIERPAPHSCMNNHIIIIITEANKKASWACWCEAGPQEDGPICLTATALLFLSLPGISQSDQWLTKRHSKAAWSATHQFLSTAC